MNQFFAREQAYKSIINRIERAKKGYPACGMKPWGRIFDTETCVWKVDEEKKRTIEHIAHLYLEEDVPFSALSQRFRMNANNIHRILTSRCGVTWEQRFRNKRCGIDEKVITIIPRLLPEEQINRVRAKCKARRTWDHASQKYPYLFSRLIFDEDTGCALTGTTNRLGRRYYRRYKGKGYLYMVNADVIEKTIMEGLIEALSTDKAMMRAVFNGQRLDEAGEEWKNKRGCLEREIEQVEKKRANLMRAILALDTDRVDVFVAKIKSEIKDLEEEEGKIRLQIEEINERLSSLPAEKEIVDRRQWIHEQLMMRMTESYFSSGRTLNDLSFKEKQRIFKLIFGREENKGKSYGIFVKCLGGQPRKFRFEACGRLGNLEGWIVSSKGKVSSFVDGELETSNDVEVIGNIARIVMESDPGGNIKEYTRGSCHV
jgi:hypothetical protein